MIGVPTLIEFGKWGLTTGKAPSRLPKFNKQIAIQNRDARAFVHELIRQAVAEVRRMYPGGRWIERPVVIEELERQGRFVILGWYGVYCPATSDAVPVP